MITLHLYPNDLNLTIRNIEYVTSGHKMPPLLATIFQPNKNQVYF